MIWNCRSREGAWIEMSVAADDRMDKGVAPARERGLKLPLFKLLI